MAGKSVRPSGRIASAAASAGDAPVSSPVGPALRVFLEVHSQSLDLHIGHHHAAAKQFEQLDAEAKLLDRHELRILRPFRVLETDAGGLHTRGQRLANVEIAADLEPASRKVGHSRRDERLEPVEVEDCDDDYQRRDGAGQEDGYGDCDLAKHETTSAGPLAVRHDVGSEIFRSLATPTPAWRLVKSTLCRLSRQDPWPMAVEHRSIRFPVPVAQIPHAVMILYHALILPLNDRPDIVR